MEGAGAARVVWDARLTGDELAMIKGDTAEETRGSAEEEDCLVSAIVITDVEDASLVTLEETVTVSVDEAGTVIVTVPPAQPSDFEVLNACSN